MNYILVEYIFSLNGLSTSLGFYFRHESVDCDDSFVKFCHLDDLKIGIKDHMRFFLVQLISANCKIEAKDKYGTTVLFETEEDHYIAFGRESTLRYLGYSFYKSV